MNKINKKMHLLLLFSLANILQTNFTYSMDFLKFETPGKDIIVFGELPKAEQQLKELQEKSKKILEKEKEFLEQKNKQAKEIAIETKKIAQDIAQKPPQEINFLKSKLELLNETNQTIKNIQSSRKQLSDSIAEHTKILEKYIKDPNFRNFSKEYTQQRRFYTFDDLQKLNQAILDQEEKIQFLEEQLQSSLIELESKEQTFEITNESYGRKKQELENFKSNPEKATTTADMFEFNSDQKLELLNLQSQLYQKKQEFDKYTIKEIKQKLALIKTKIFVANLQLKILKKITNNIKQTLRITESDIANDKAKLEQEKTKLYKTLGAERIKVEQISKKYETGKKELENLSKKYQLPLSTELERWDVDPQTRNEYARIIAIEMHNEALSALYREKEFYEARMAKSEDELFKFKTNIEIKETFYKAETRKFASEKDISNEIKKYNKINLDIKAKVAKFKEKINTTKNNLKNKNVALENVEKLKNKVSRGFKGWQKENLLSNIAIAKVNVKKQIKLMQDSIDIYENIISVNNNIEKQISFILSELDQLVGKWYRPAYAIKFEKIPNIIPELKVFIKDLKNYLFTFSIFELFENIKMAFPKKIDLLSFIIALVMLLLLLFLLRVYAPKIKNTFLNLTPNNRSFKFLFLLFAFILDFIVKYFISIGVWILLFASIKMAVIPDRYITILFYLASIPYLIYITNRFFAYFREYNKKYNTLSFITPHYQERLLKVIAIIFYSTIAIQLFRKAFELGIYYQSELPPILSALNWIIGQIALIMLITKQLIKKVIPKNWRWLQERSNLFYYIILAIAVVIIVMANPYIGLGRLLLYAIQRLILTAILCIGLYMLHKIGKKISLKLFFKTEEEVVQARFTYGKTVYGLYVILSFTLLILIGLLVGSYIWDWGISLESIKNLLEKRIFWAGKEEVSILSFIKIFLFIISGAMVSLLINKYVLRKIFDLLLVETGVQYAMTTILKYVIITTFLVIGFNSVGLGELVKYLLGASLLGIGWIIKDPLADFIYYFFILIQRPLKIGDYIKLPDGTQGVVRKITPRAVILKFRNSENILVPNSKLLSGSIVNWNYFTRFVAFDDIIVTIPYKFDPNKVRKILFDVLEQHPNILKSPKPIIRLENFGENGYAFLIRGFVSSHYTLDMWDIASDIRLAIVKQLEEHNIEIALPIRIIETTKFGEEELPEKASDKYEKPKEGE